MLLNIIELDIINCSAPNINDGEIEIFASGGTEPYLYSINNSYTTGNTYQTGNTFFGLSGGSYFIYVKDFSDTIDFIGGIEVHSPFPIVTLDIQDCSSKNITDGSITIDVSGVSQTFTYSLGNIFQSGNTFLNLSGGTYNVSVRDNHNSTTIINGVRLFVPSESASNVPIIYNLIITNLTRNNSLDGSIKVFASGGTSPYTYSINNNPYQVSNYFSGLPEGIFTASVKDALESIGTLSGIKISSETVIGSGGSGSGSYGRGVNRYRTKVNVKNIKVCDVDSNECIKVSVII